MTTPSRIINSIEGMFLSASNIRDITAYIGHDATKEMKDYASHKPLDDYESIQMDYSETLDFINNDFVKKHKNKGYELSMATGQAHPKYYIDEGVERYGVNDFRSHDAQSTQEVHRSNENFRYGKTFINYKRYNVYRDFKYWKRHLILRPFCFAFS